jgi:hypothetical protein
MHHLGRRLMDSVLVAPAIDVRQTFRAVKTAPPTANRMALRRNREASGYINDET